MAIFPAWRPVKAKSNRWCAMANRLWCGPSVFSIDGVGSRLQRCASLREESPLSAANPATVVGTFGQAALIQFTYFRHLFSPDGKVGLARGEMKLRHKEPRM